MHSGLITSIMDNAKARTPIPNTKNGIIPINPSEAIT